MTHIGQPELGAYFSTDIFIAILKGVGPDLTAQRFQQVAAHYTYQIPGVIGPSYYAAGFYTGAPCGESVYSNGTSWSIASPVSEVVVPGDVAGVMVMDDDGPLVSGRSLSLVRTVPSGSTTRREW